MGPQTAILYSYLLWPPTNILVLKKKSDNVHHHYWEALHQHKRIRRPSVIHEDRTDNATISKTLQVKGPVATQNSGFAPTEAKKMLANLSATALAGLVEQRWLGEKTAWEIFFWSLFIFPRWPRRESMRFWPEHFRLHKKHPEILHEKPPSPSHLHSSPVHVFCDILLWI